VPSSVADQDGSAWTDPRPEPASGLPAAGDLASGEAVAGPVEAGLGGSGPDPGLAAAADSAVPDTGLEPGPAAPADAGGPDAEGPEAEVEPTLPEPVRQRVVTLAAGALTGLTMDEVPVVLRRVARFAPNRRARLGGAMIAGQLAGDPLFRQRVANRVLSDAGELGAAVRDGVCPAAADPVEVGALAYLARPEGWLDLVEAAAHAVRAEADSAAMAELIRDVEARAARAEHDRAVARVEADKLRDELAKLRDEASGMREELRAVSRQLRELQARERKVTDMLASEKGRAARVAADHEAEVRRLRARLAEAESAVGAARQVAKDTRAVDDARLWLLLETIGQAATGLRRELALDPADRLPADFVADTAADRPETVMAARHRALDADDPARLDHFLALPKVHLVVDGYNVTKRGFGEVSLEQQRSRLVSGLGGIAAQTGAEVTVVFDGAERVHGLPPAPRGVRVLFSRKGETADELIRRLVRAEPAGRAIVVISSDKEVADGVRRHGAYPLGSDALLRRLSRS
jgi:predicted RNA-binding protein with PIN domain